MSILLIATVVVDGYTNYSTLTSGDALSLGSQLLLVCQVVGLPYGTPLNYTWTCPNGDCEVRGHYGRKVYNEHILAVNIIYSTYNGTYTCCVTSTGGQQASGSFTFSVLTGTYECCALSLIELAFTEKIIERNSIIIIYLYIGPFRWSCCPQCRETHTS